MAKKVKVFKVGKRLNPNDPGNKKAKDTKKKKEVENGSEK